MIYQIRAALLAILALIATVIVIAVLGLGLVWLTGVGARLFGPAWDWATRPYHGIEWPWEDGDGVIDLTPDENGVWQATPPADEAKTPSTDTTEEKVKDLRIPVGKVAIITGKSVQGSINGDTVQGNKGFVFAIPATGANYTLEMTRPHIRLVDADDAEAEFRKELERAGEGVCQWHPDSWD